MSGDHWGFPPLQPTKEQLEMYEWLEEQRQRLFQSLGVPKHILHGEKRGE